MTFEELCESDLEALAGGEFGDAGTLTAKGGDPAGAAIDLTVGDVTSREEEAEAGQRRVLTMQAICSRAAAAAILGRDVAEEDLVTTGGRTWAVTEVGFDGAAAVMTLEAMVEVSKVRPERVRK